MKHVGISEIYMGQNNGYHWNIHRISWVIHGKHPKWGLIKPSTCEVSQMNLGKWDE
jgi:hypothetical protein